MGRRPAPTSRSRLVRGGSLFSAAVIAAGLSLTALPADAAPETTAPAGVEAAAKKVATDKPGVTANLFEWNWSSVGSECTDVLGPAGYSGVQVAPPQNSMKRTSLGNGSNDILHPWWEVYQPVTYDLTSRMGTASQFRAMVKTCRKAGVKVYVDAVINHMTGQGSTSYGGQNFTPYHYESYGPDDFHFQHGCPSIDGGIQDFNNKLQVWNCNLVGLEDLRTETPKVRAELAAYLNTLIGYGVSGFRVDAAKHLSPADLEAIHAKLNLTKDKTKPYWVLEVGPGSPGVLSPRAYARQANVLGLDAVKQIRDAFKSYPAQHVGSIATLEVFGTDSGLTPSGKTLSFVQNHDTERNGDSLSYKDGATNTLATQWLLASGYGTPQVYSGFSFPNDDPATPNENEASSASPPATADGLITNTDCASAAWNCLDRDPGVVGMVGWHNYVGKAKRQHWWTDDANVIAFSRGSRAWAGFNNGTVAKEIRVQTGLRGGTYCNIITGEKSGGSCTGTTIRVNRKGVTRVTIGAKSAVAFTKQDRI